MERILTLADAYRSRLHLSTGKGWDQGDVVLITYGDQVSAAGASPLATLGRFLAGHSFHECFNTIHLLPFFPYSSDDGFAVIDFRSVDPELGTWKDVQRLGEHWDLMFDLVLNHVSSRSRWLQSYIAGVPAYTDYFIEMDPETDLSAVTRPRASPLLTTLETSRGVRHLWATFSADQIDLNYANSDVLIEMIDVLLQYLSQGARIVRLDAVAFLWKQPGTSSIHLPETHTVIKILRDLVDELAPDAILLTETNVPHEENVSYFGNGDEAHMVYQFALPPLLLDAYLNENAEYLCRWLADLTDPRPGTTFFNFTASHDGVGVRPLEGLVPAERLSNLIRMIEECGGLVSKRRQPDGSDAPYELNITYVDALGRPTDPSPATHARRFLASQALMLALQGIPGVYINSLTGTGNDCDGLRASGQARRINRRKHRLEELEAAIARRGSLQQLIFDAYRKLLATRRRQPAFHPGASQELVDPGNRAVLAFERASIDGGQRILVVANMSHETEWVRLPSFDGDRWVRDLLDDRTQPTSRDFVLAPLQVCWLESGPRHRQP